MSGDVSRAFGAWHEFAALAVTSDWFLMHSNLFRLRSACLRRRAARRRALPDGRWKLFVRWRHRCREVISGKDFLLAASGPSPLAWRTPTGDEAVATGAQTAPLQASLWDSVHRIQPRKSAVPVPDASPVTGPRISVRRWRAMAPIAFEASHQLSCSEQHRSSRSLRCWSDASQRQIQHEQRRLASLQHWQRTCIARWRALHSIGEATARNQVRLTILAGVLRQATARRGLRRLWDLLVRAWAEEGLMERAAGHAGRLWLARLSTGAHRLRQIRLARDARVEACRSEGLLRRQGEALERWRARVSIRRRLCFLRVFFAVGTLVMAMRCWRLKAERHMRVEWAWRICLQKRLCEWKRRSATHRSVSWAPLPVKICPVDDRPSEGATTGSILWS